jgi:membrane-associated phospholipid phosphatase
VSTPLPADLEGRRLAILAGCVVGSLVGFAVLAVRAWQNTVFAWDARFSIAIHDLENRDAIWNRHVDAFDLVLSVYVQALGAVLISVLVLVLIRWKRYREAVFVAASVIGAAAIGVVAKTVVAQPPVDPNGSGFSFPSGHAVRSMTSALVLAAISWETRWRVAVTAAAVTIAVLIGVAVVYEEWHWASDVLGGWLLSIAWVGCVALAMRPSRRLREHRRLAPAGRDT